MRQMEAGKIKGYMYLKKYNTILLFCLFQFNNLITTAQEQVYDNFEGVKILHYGERSGVLDTIAKNPAPNEINNSEKCALYVRNGAKKFANIKMNLGKNLTGIETYATYVGNPRKIKLKLYTAAPAGTLVEILLGSRSGNNDYPAGTHSQYQAYTTKSKEWEQLEFKFSQIPQGSETSGMQIDQVVLLFYPNSSNSDTYYFDDLMGPPLLGIDKTVETVAPEKTIKEKKVKPLNKKIDSGKKQ